MFVSFINRSISYSVIKVVIDTSFPLRDSV